MHGLCFARLRAMWQDQDSFGPAIPLPYRGTGSVSTGSSRRRLTNRRTSDAALRCRVCRRASPNSQDRPASRRRIPGANCRRVTTCERPRSVEEANGAEGDRTLNLRIANAALSQLSYRPIWITGIQSTVPMRSTQGKMNGRGPRVADRHRSATGPERRLDRTMPGHAYLEEPADDFRTHRSFGSLWPRLARRASHGTRWPPSLRGRVVKQAPARLATGRLDSDRRKPGLHRHRPRHLGPQDPRARLHPGRRRRNLSPLVHRLRRSTARRPCRWARPPRATAFTGPAIRKTRSSPARGSRTCASSATTAPTSCSPRARTTSRIS